MAKHLAYRIIEGAYTYEYVISKRPDLKQIINNALIEMGRQDLIIQ